jgi:hypothetical protein
MFDFKNNMPVGCIEWMEYTRHMEVGTICTCIWQIRHATKIRRDKCHYIFAKGTVHPKDTILNTYVLIFGAHNFIIKHY